MKYNNCPIIIIKIIKNIKNTKNQLFSVSATSFDMFRILTSYDILRHLTTSSKNKTSYDMLRHPTTCYDILRHATTTYDIFRQQNMSKHVGKTEFEVFPWKIVFLSLYYIVYHILYYDYSTSMVQSYSNLERFSPLLRL